MQLSVLAEPRFAGVLGGNPQISEILIHRDFFSTVAEIRKRRFPVVFNQHGGPTSALLTAASGIPIRVCWERRQFGFIYNVHVPASAAFYGRDDVHTVEQRMTQFYATGLPRGPIPSASIYPSAEARASVTRLLAANGISAAEGYAVVRPGATHPNKRWAVENFVAIARWLHNERGIPVVINLGPDERDVAGSLRVLCGPEVPVLDALSLSELMALLVGAKLYVGNDSGPAHIAAAARCPVVVIFGASNPVHWRPWGTEYRLLRSEQPPVPGLPSVRIEDVQAACDELFATAVIRRGANAASVQQ